MHLSKSVIQHYQHQRKGSDHHLLAVLGFTLIELIAVILLLSVTLVGSASFIRWGALTFADGAERQRLLEESRFVVERLSREIRAAVPASVRLNSNGSCVEFVPILGVGSYLSLPTQSPDTTVTVVADSSYTYATGDDLILQATQAQDIYASSNNTRTNTTAYSSTVSGLAQATITLAPTQFDAAFQANPSRPNRYYMVNDQVSYCVLSDGTMRRFQYPDVYPSQPTVTTLTNGELMAEQIANTAGGNFSFANSEQTTLSLYLAFQRQNAEAMEFYHLIGLRNAR